MASIPFWLFCTSVYSSLTRIKKFTTQFLCTGKKIERSEIRRFIHSFPTAVPRSSRVNGSCWLDMQSTWRKVVSGWDKKSWICRSSHGETKKVKCVVNAALICLLREPHERNRLTPLSWDGSHGYLEGICKWVCTSHFGKTQWECSGCFSSGVSERKVEDTLNLKKRAFPKQAGEWKTSLGIV